MDWLGLYSKFESAKNFVQSNDFKNQDEYQTFINQLLTKNISLGKIRVPLNPQKEYKDKGWKGWPHFLGKTK